MKAQVTITMDTEIRDDLKKLAKKAGTNFSNLLSMAAAHMVNTQKINFDYIPYTDEYSPEDYIRIKKVRDEAMANLKAGHNVYTWDEMMAEIEAEKNTE